MSDPRKMFEDDYTWMDEHREELCKAYPNQWIAVKDRIVIGNAIEFDDLLKQIGDPEHTAIEFIETVGDVDEYF